MGLPGIIPCTLWAARRWGGRGGRPGWPGGNPGPAAMGCTPSIPGGRPVWNGIRCHKWNNSNPETSLATFTFNIIHPRLIIKLKHTLTGATVNFIGLYLRDWEPTHRFNSDSSNHFNFLRLNSNYLGYWTETSHAKSFSGYEIHTQTSQYLLIRSGVKTGRP